MADFDGFVVREELGDNAFDLESLDVGGNRRIDARHGRGFGRTTREKENSKYQTPNSKQAPISNFQNFKTAEHNSDQNHSNPRCKRCWIWQEDQRSAGPLL